MTMRKELPKNIVSQDGRLYFNKWYRRVRYTGALNLVDSNANRKTAGHISAKINAEMKLGKFNPADYPMFAGPYEVPQLSGHPIFADYAEQWLQSKKYRVADSTLRTYRDLINNRLSPFFGDFPVDQISKQLVERWLLHLTRDVSLVYANDCLRRLKSVIYDAEADFLFVSHLNRVKPLKSSEPKRHIKDEIFTLDEASRLYYVAAPRLRTMMLTSMLAGLRTGEVIALQRNNCDFDANLLHVQATMSEGHRKTPKSYAGNRSINMHPVLRQHLIEILASHSHEFVFISRRGKPFRVRQDFYREYSRVKEQANVRNLRWYAFRKLFASLRFACNEMVPAAIADDMGHKDVALTFNTYSRAMPHMNCRFEDLDFPLPPSFLNVMQSA